MQLIECVPNISEGKNKEIINAIASEITDVTGVTLLNVDSGAAANRTVYTFTGVPDAVTEAAFRVYKKAQELISMKEHKGEHPRMGAVDVCPLIPIQGIRPEELDNYAHQLARRVGNELEIPVYLYEKSSHKDHRIRLEQIRHGEYEGFAEKIKLFEWSPDYGPKMFNDDFGVTAIGVRNYLLAYNINLSTKDVEIAKNIAIQIRESGGTFQSATGETITKKPGLLKGVKAIGWYIKDYDVVQVSMNITDYRMIGLARVFEQVSRLALDYGVTVIGSELIGLVPHEAISNAGMYFQHKYPGSDLDELDVAINCLGLRQVKSFEPEKQILEYVAGIAE